MTALGDDVEPSYTYCTGCNRLLMAPEVARKVAYTSESYETFQSEVCSWCWPDILTDRGHARMFMLVRLKLRWEAAEGRA